MLPILLPAPPHKASNPTEGIAMPATNHSTASERHFQAEHTHDAAAASRDKHPGFTSHEEEKFAEEQSREAREHAQHEKKPAPKV
jgi:hypothetical protein